MISVFTMSFNEEVLMQFFIDHYRARFQHANIYVFDNQSTDRTVEICKDNNCTVYPYNSGGQVNDEMICNHKNSCWRGSPTDWVLVCDTDELLDINEAQLRSEEASGVNIIKGIGYHMVNMVDSYDLYAIDHGVRDPFYDKILLFDRRKVWDINYEPGCHVCHPSPPKVVRYSDSAYLMKHYKFVHPDYSIARHRVTRDRLSEDNKRLGLGAQYLAPDEEALRWFQEARRRAEKI